jgi:hypothetical protein
MPKITVSGRRAAVKARGQLSLCQGAGRISYDALWL